MVHYRLELFELAGFVAAESHVGEGHAIFPEADSEVAVTELGHCTGSHDDPLPVRGETIVCRNIIPKIMDPMTSVSALPSDFVAGWLSTFMRAL